MSESPVPDEQHLATDRQAKRPHKGGRKPLSCLACRRHKLKCDRKVPCGTCTRFRREKFCRLNPAPPKPGRPRGREQTAAEVDAASPEGAYNVDSSVREPITDASTGVGLLSLRNSQLAVVGPRADAAAETRDVPSFFRALGLDANTTSIPVSSLPQLLAEIQRANQPSLLWHMMEGDANRRYWETQLRSALPSRSMCDLMVNYYLDHINWIFQITHVPSFRRQYEDFWEAKDGQEMDFMFTALLFTIISVSALFIPPGTAEIFGCPKESIRDLAHVWHKVSHQALRAGDYESKPCIVQLQTFSITQFYWYSTNKIDTLNSRLGQAVRTAQTLGLDKDLTPSQTLHDEMRHRIWWDLVDSDTARFFKLMNNHICYRNPNDGDSYEAICSLDDEVLNITRSYPWFFQLDQEGRPPSLPHPMGEIITWQNHIIRTCISTQRIRMYRPFISHRIGDSWAKCIEAAEDAMAVYRTLRWNKSSTSLQKFLPQAYQMFSVAVTVTALLLVEGSLPIPNVWQQIKNMADDLKILEDEGCVSPVASRGRQVLTKMLSLVEMGNNGAPVPEDTEDLVADIGFIFGGEQAAQTYLQRLASRNQRRGGRDTSVPSTISEQKATPTSVDSSAYSHSRFQYMVGGHGVVDASIVENSAGYMGEQQQQQQQQTSGVYQMDLMMDDMVLQNMLNFDMTALMADSRFE
ncbi:uncharacterized transcriptional regulatory protein C139.03 [Trichoderma asperellum]|uniref:Uncharacterized transcriptional regulatory protein C139.03 n=1 Tax=Trichoderma asperellum TaxID=101201 RepID=A0A6V8QPY6_TRIAP|nr:uncharacterized transcriptional regulatory protein C139.03 [Trichoderma asperellum]